MNINELNRIRTINIDAELAGTESGTGTFKEILDNVMNGIIIPLTNNSGTIIGISFDSKATNLIEDNVAQRKFEMRYCCKPVMNWVLKALELKADRKIIAEVIENEEGIKVVTNTGEVIEIETYRVNSYAPSTPRVELPSEVEITYDEANEYGIEDCDESEPLVGAYLREYLRDKYDHYLSGKHESPTIEFDDEARVIRISNIHWGRKR